MEPPHDGEVLDEAALGSQAARELAEEMGIDTAPEVLRLWVVTRGKNNSIGLTYLAPAIGSCWGLVREFGDRVRVRAGGTSRGGVERAAWWWWKRR